jgi:hypothetical protein
MAAAAEKTKPADDKKADASKTEIVDQKTGETKLRTIDPIEIVEIVNDPDDGSIERYIHRRWMSNKFEEATGNRQTRRVWRERMQARRRPCIY